MRHRPTSRSTAGRSSAATPAASARWRWRTSLAAEDAATRLAADPLAPKPPHHPAKAKAVICLFQHGGPSQMDLFDPKPELTKQHGKPHPGQAGSPLRHADRATCSRSPFKFAKRGKSGMELSELLPHTAGIVDDITLVRSMTTDSVDHEAALRLIHSGKIFAGRPAWGSWVLYGLGTERQDLPAYVVLSDPGGLPVDGDAQLVVAACCRRSTRARRSAPAGTPVAAPGHARPTCRPTARRNQLDLLDELNARPPPPAPRQRRAGGADRQLRDWPRGCRRPCPTCSTSRRRPRRRGSSTASTTRSRAEYGKRCLLARRLVERGVRFVQIFLSGQPWDTHSKNAESLKDLCAMTDQPERRRWCST